MSALGSLLQPLIRVLAVRSNVHLGRRVHIGPGSLLWAPKDLTVDDDVYIGRHCTLQCNGRIGRGTIVASGVGMIGRNDHDVRSIGVMARYSPWVGSEPSTSPQEVGRVTIGEDVWIGFGAIILSNVNVGRGAVIGAGAVVVHDVPRYAVVVGNPARSIGLRFTPEEAVLHEALLAQLDSPLAPTASDDGIQTP